MNACLLTLENEKKLTITGVKSVERFSDSVIVLRLENKKMTISGRNLEVLSFSQGNGNFSSSGEVDKISYSSRKKLSSLFQ